MSTFTVTTNADSGLGSLRAAIALANAAPGSTVNFDPLLTGTITLTSGELAITSNMTIIGPGSGVINVQRTAGIFRIFNITTAAITVSISGLTISDANTAANGGGLNCNVSSTINLTDCIFSNNVANSGGGIFFNGASTLTINSCSFQSNIATSTLGGGVRANNVSSVLIVNNTTFLSNNTGGIMYAGGITGSSTITGCSFQSNIGGAIRTTVAGATMTINNCTFLNNTNASAVDASSPVNINNSVFTSNTGSAIGGALSASAGGSLNNSIFQNNSATNIGGGISLGAGTFVVNNCTIKNNIATSGLAGGLYCAATAQIFNSTFNNNTVNNGTGGGIYFDTAATKTIINCTINGNIATAAGVGGGVALNNNANLTMINCTISNNTASLGNGIFITNTSILNIGNTVVAVNPTLSSLDFRLNDLASVITSLGHNFIGNATGVAVFFVPSDQIGTTASPLNPLLLPLANNGGQTDTMLPQTIPSFSPLINAGDNTLVTTYFIYPELLNSGQPIDQRGFSRIVFGIVDIGSVEVQPIVCFSGESIVLTKNKITGIISEILARDVISDVHEVYSTESQSFVDVKLNVVSGPYSRFFVIKKNMLGVNQPNKDFFVTSGHKLVINGIVTKARDIPEAKIVKTRAQKLYSICTEKQTSIIINGLSVMTWCEKNFIDYANKNNMIWTNNAKIVEIAML